MLTRYWQWTSGPAAAADSGLPFGPLRYRAWTSAAVPTSPADSGLPFGPLRFRAWTSGAAIIVPPAVDHGGGGMPLPRVITVPDYLRLLQLDDEELLWLLVTSAATDILQ